MSATNIIVRTLKLTSPKYIQQLTRNSSLWTSDNRVKSPLNDVEIPNRLIPEQIWENMERWSDKTAVVSNVVEQGFLTSSHWISAISML